MDEKILSQIVIIIVGGVVSWLMRDIASSVKELNIKIATIINEMQYHDKRITNLEEKSERRRIK